MSRHALIPHCSAHGLASCPMCSLIRSADLARGGGACPSCESWANYGMHWDTCPRRIRSVHALSDEFEQAHRNRP